MQTVAALYVDPKGVYGNLPGVEVWDEARDARTYAGPWPVVAHPPCNRWSKLAVIWAHRWPIGDDGGCFAAALDAVRRFGGVLEHPASSKAWETFDLPHPIRNGWAGRLGDPGWATEVDQAAYGHSAQKRTWLYAVASDLPAMHWLPVRGSRPLANMNSHGYGPSRTPEPLRDVLLAIARKGRA